MANVKHFIEYIMKLLLDIVAPKNPEITAIEEKGVAGFLALASPGEKYGIYYLFPYKNPVVRTAIIEIKNFPNKTMANVIGGALGSLLFKHSPDNPNSNLPNWHIPENALILPIPISDKKRRARGWNQCDLIVEALGRNISPTGIRNVDIRTDILIKIRETADQVGKNREERFENLKDCFAVKSPELVYGRNVVVLDDILTTGSTLLSAKKVLFSAGAKNVFCLAVAH